MLFGQAIVHLIQFLAIIRPIPLGLAIVHPIQRGPTIVHPILLGPPIVLAIGRLILLLESANLILLGNLFSNQLSLQSVVRN